MKNLTKMWDAWEISGGKLIGDYKPHGRVTVEKDWQLNVTGAVYGTSNRGPYRWFQREDNLQVETEVPNVESIETQRSIDADAGTASITLSNQNHYDHGEEPADGSGTTQLGRPGYYTWTYGQSDEAQARWGQIENEWADVLVPNALIRTYEGYGGNDLSISAAVAAGHLTLTGTWLIDTVTVGSTGKVQLKLRDMSKLLTDQYLYPPLVPEALYPVRHCRYLFDNYDLAFDGSDEPRGGWVNALSLRTNTVLKYFDSSSDKWYGFNAGLHGHRPSDSIDGSVNTWAISEGYGSANLPYATPWWEYTVQGQFDQIYILPHNGNYEIYISVFENGAWVEGPGTVPYSQPLSVNIEADIPYVFRGATPYALGLWHKLPRLFDGYEGTRVRVSFRNLQQTPLGPYFFRAGIVEIKAKVESYADQSDIPATLYMCSYPSDLGEGYWVVDNYGRVYAFGDARIETKTGVQGATGQAGFGGTSAAIARTPTGQGYIVLEKSGAIHTYGDAPTGLGSAYGAAGRFDGWNSISINAANDGYVIGSRFGNVSVHGSMTDHGGTNALSPEISAFRGGDSHVDPRVGADGYWVVDRGGRVYNFGDAQDFGDLTETVIEGEHITHIVPTSTGLGYWLLGLAGTVEAMGDAVDYGGEPASFYDEDSFEYWNSDQHNRISWSMAPAQGDIGYWVIYADGRIIPFGEAYYYGSPSTQSFLRKDGTYKDYSDVVREVLNWSGFLLYSNTPDSGSRAPTYGNIEDTGIHAGNECLSEDLFDKKPPLDVITELKEIVGYNFWIDSDGAVRFQSPNWWAAGNFYEDGTYTTFIPEVDERLQLTDYSVTFGDDSLRSEIVIASEEPDIDTNESTTITTIVPFTANILRGMVRPAIWSNGVFNNAEEQKIMAELISLHIWFQQRIGRVSCQANPAIEIDDQVRIYERTTSESYVHYVRGISTSHNLITGEYTMSLETHWLGQTDNWVVTRDDLLGDAVTSRYGLSPELVEYLLEQQGSRSVEPARATQFDSSTPYTISYPGDIINPGDPGTEGGGS